jgi:hypothetical protein
LTTPANNITAVSAIMIVVAVSARLFILFSPPTWLCYVCELAYSAELMKYQRY